MDIPTSSLIKNLYLYLVSFVALMMLVFSCADIVNIALRTFVFPKADNDTYYYQEAVCPAPVDSSTSTKKSAPCTLAEEQRKRNDESRLAQKQRDLVRDLSMILVALPLFGYHWWLVRKKE